MSPTVPSPVDDLRDALLAILRSMVDKPAELQLATEPTKDGILFRVTSAATDTAKLIGKNGRTARALRVILLAAGRKYGIILTVDVDNHHAETTSVA